MDRLPGDRHPKPVWLWCSAPQPTPTALDRLWHAYLRRFDIEHTFRFLKQTLDWTRPRLRTPQAADRWTWLIIAAHTQLRLARHLAEDLRRPWEKPTTRPGRLTPARVRRGFRHLRPKTTLPASAPNPPDPAPGAHPDHPTASAHPTTTSAKTPNRTPPSKTTTSRQVKQQDKAPCPRRCSGANDKPTSDRTGLRCVTTPRPVRITYPPVRSGTGRTPDRTRPTP
ncbi:MAG: transposase [Pseudonocardiaceae bacterium]